MAATWVNCPTSHRQRPLSFMSMSISAQLRIFASGISALCLSLAACSQSVASHCSPLAQSIPQRSAQARGATEFVAAVSAMSEPERDLAIRGELLAGNMPGFLRKLQPVSLSTQLPGGDVVRLTICVLTDYLSLGADDDFLLVPMSLNTALTVAARFGFTLPTRRMVDLIYGQSKVQMAPQPLPASDQMRSTHYYQMHDALVKQQRALTGVAVNVLTAGDKKDLVLSARLWSRPGRVAIYGWHRGVGAPIQPLSTVHGTHYADYSHGVRLVSNIVFVNGQAQSIFDVLADSRLATLLSDEGPLLHAAELFDVVPKPAVDL